MVASLAKERIGHFDVTGGSSASTESNGPYSCFSTRLPQYIGSHHLAISAPQGSISLWFKRGAG